MTAFGIDDGNETKSCFLEVLQTASLYFVDLRLPISFGTINENLLTEYFLTITCIA